MDDKEYRAYILNIKFGIKQWRIWFIGAVSKDAEWNIALKALDEIGNSCSNPDEFYRKVIQHFQNAGFLLVKD